MSDWMQNLEWLRERRAAIIRRIEQEGTEQDPDHAFLTPNFEKTHGRRGARRDALVIFTTAISEATNG